jgi:hypothetical protein
LSPRSASYNFALTSAAANLQAVFNDLLRSPAPCAIEYPRSPSIYKPLPGRPRSASLPPVELPGSILQENHGFPTCASTEAWTEDTASVRPASQNLRRSTHPRDNSAENGEEFLELLKLFPEPLGHAKSVPDLNKRNSEMRSVRSGNALNSGTIPTPGPLKVRHKKSLSETDSRRRSKSIPDTPASSDRKTKSLAPPTCGDSSAKSVRARVGVNRLLQPSPRILEGQVWTDNVEDRRSRHNEVRILFPSWRGFIRHSKFLHNETVSELSSSLLSTRIRHVALEIDFLVLARCTAHFPFVHRLCSMGQDIERTVAAVCFSAVPPRTKTFEREYGSHREFNDSQWIACSNILFCAGLRTLD